MNMCNHYYCGECWGTRERDECRCGGDTTKCDFYPEKRKKHNHNSYSSPFDRPTALAVLKDLSAHMYPSYDLFGGGTLVIDRPDFEEIRKKYLD